MIVSTTTACRCALTATALLLLLAACGPGSPIEPEPDPDTLPEPIEIPEQGTDSTLDVATWNLLYFGSKNAGPDDEKLQMARIRDVIKGTDADLWGVQEVTSNATFDTLLTHLPGYDGLLANDSTVTHGSDYYTGGEQKVGVVFKTSMVRITGARLILTEFDSDFAGRPPLELRARLTQEGKTRDAVIIVMHLKAGEDTASYRKRAAASKALKEYVDSTLADDLVLIPGDWNDDVDESITEGRDTPFRNFVDDSADWIFPTAELSEKGSRSHVRYDDMIDHILGSDEVMEDYEEDSALAYEVDEYIPNYAETTSDHYPVLVRFLPP